MKKLIEDVSNKTRDVLGVVVDVNLFNENQLEYIEKKLVEKKLLKTSGQKGAGAFYSLNYTLITQWK